MKLIATLIAMVAAVVVLAASAGGTRPVLVELCHKPGTPAEQTKVVPAAAVPGHLGHGDYLGPCVPEEPPVECPEGTHEYEGECVPNHEEPPVEEPPVEEPPAGGSSSRPPRVVPLAPDPAPVEGELPHTL